MRMVEWTPMFSLGAKEIDDDHRRLFAIAAEMGQAVKNRDIALCRAKVDEFIDAAIGHFAAEEAFLVRTRFPTVEAHKLSHGHLLAKARELKRACDGQQGHGQMEQCYEQAISLLVDEIIRGDSAYKSHLQYYGFSSQGRG